MQQMEENSRYSKRGVSSTKNEVHAVVDHMDKGLFSGTFCKVTQDLLTGNPSLCNVIHSDGAGTKSILGYLAYRENDDVSVFHGIAQDSLVMNLDDLACVGIWDKIVISSTVNRNARNFPGEALAALIEGTENFLQSLRDLGINVESGGGETADVGDLTGTVAVDSCAVAVAKRSEIIDNARICPGLSIIGFSSFGQATYEKNYNSGIGSNGLTSARHDVFDKYLKIKYPETYDNSLSDDLIYIGSKKLSDKIPGIDLDAGKLVLSPTRTYAPVVKEILSKIERKKIHGIIHCSGGAQTKVMNFVKNKHIIKDNLFETPPVFKLIQSESKTSWKEMYQVFNMGHRLEIYTDENSAQSIINISKSFNLDAKIIGRVEDSKENKLSISTAKGIFEY